MYTVKLVAAHILRNYRLSTPLQLHELKIKLSVSFRFLTTHLIQVQQRENWKRNQQNLSRQRNVLNKLKIVALFFWIFIFPLNLFVCLITLEM